MRGPSDGPARICFVGAESTGKTTVIRALTTQLGCGWVPEYGRVYTVGKKAAGTNDDWVAGDFVHIAVGQQTLEDALAYTERSQYLLCDTDAFATVLWEERYLGVSSAETADIANSRHYDLYVLCDPSGVPYEFDGVRERADLRQWMHERFVTELAARCLRTNEPWLVVTGDARARASQVLSALRPSSVAGVSEAEPTGLGAR